jgi:hypothetical protein
VSAVSDEPHAQDSIVSAGVEVVEAEDVVLPITPAWPISQQMPTAWVTHDGATSSSPQGPGHDRASQPIDSLAEAVIAAHMLASPSEDGATLSSRSNSSSRQSA